MFSSSRPLIGPLMNLRNPGFWWSRPVFSSSRPLIGPLINLKNPGFWWTRPVFSSSRPLIGPLINLQPRRVPMVLLKNPGFWWKHRYWVINPCLGMSPHACNPPVRWEIGNFYINLFFIRKYNYVHISTPYSLCVLYLIKVYFIILLKF